MPGIVNRRNRHAAWSAVAACLPPSDVKCPQSVHRKAGQIWLIATRFAAPGQGPGKCGLRPGFRYHNKGTGRAPRAFRLRVSTGTDACVSSPWQRWPWPRAAPRSGPPAPGRSTQELLLISTAAARFGSRRSSLSQVREARLAKPSGGRFRAPNTCSPASRAARSSLSQVREARLAKPSGGRFRAPNTCSPASRAARSSLSQVHRTCSPASRAAPHSLARST
jgi:hypothetical protein